MPTVVIEEIGSQSTEISVDSPSQELRFKVHGSNSEPDVRAAVENELPASIDITSAFFGTIPIVIQSYKVDHIGPATWDGMAKYGRTQPRTTTTQNSHTPGSGSSGGGGTGNDNQPNGTLTLSFDGVGGTAHIQTSKQTVNVYKYATTVTPPRYKNAIGVTKNGVEGVDITVPIFKFTYQYHPHEALMTPGYILTLMGMAGRTNDATWKGFAAGEVLYLGATGQPRGSKDWDLSLHFIASPNLTNQTIGDITGIVKAGWDYIWIKYRQGTDANHHIETPAFVYVERVYDPDDFRKLGIGA